MSTLKKILIAGATLVFMSGVAQAACEVKHGSTGNVLTNHPTNSHVESDCASAATVADQGIVISDHEGRIGVNEGDIAALQTENADQQAEIDAGAAKNVEQDGRLDDVEDKNADQDGTLADHETRITANKDKNDQQDTRLSGHDTTLANHNTRITSNTNRIGSLETVTESHGNRLNAHDAMLSQHAATLESHGGKLGEHDKLLAIAMAMPDAWLSDTKSFGIFGSVGGTESETAVGFAAIGRIDQNWSLNAKFGADVDFENFGWQVGAGAQW